MFVGEQGMDTSLKSALKSSWAVLALRHYEFSLHFRTHYERGKNLKNCKFHEDKDFVWSLHPEVPTLSDSPHLAAQWPASWSMAVWALWRVLCTGPKKYKLQTSLASEILPSVTQSFSVPSWQSFQFPWHKKRKKRERRERKEKEKKKEEK